MNADDYHIRIKKHIDTLYVDLMGYYDFNKERYDNYKNGILKSIVSDDYAFAKLVCLGFVETCLIIDEDQTRM